MLSKHYASDMDILDNDFQLSERHMYYFYSTINAMENFIETNAGDANGEILNDEVFNTIISNFIEAMDDDFNSAAAIANLHVIFKYINNIIKNAKKNDKQIIANTLAKALNNIRSVYCILGLFEQKPEDFIINMKEKYLKKLKVNLDYIEKQIEKRTDAKRVKDFEIADKIRTDLEKDGIILIDTREGTKWDFKVLYNFN